jgi:hypothetical protein
MRRSRISVRLSDSQLEHLEANCRETERTITDIVHQALDAFLTPKAGIADSTGPPPRLFPPEEILTAVCKYFAWGGDMDPRAELKRQFIEVLACAFALTKVFPRDKAIQRLYLALRPLCPYFGMDTVRQSRGGR